MEIGLSAMSEGYHDIYSAMYKSGNVLTWASVSASIADSVTGILHFMNDFAPALTVLLGLLGFFINLYFRRKDSLYLVQIYGERRKKPRD